MEGPGSTVPANLLRLSIGIEDAEDLIDDLNQALK
jgi:cystathionine gamma-synthase